jgi:hypothetical protein
MEIPKDVSTANLLLDFSAREPLVNPVFALRLAEMDFWVLEKNVMVEWDVLLTARPSPTLFVQSMESVPTPTLF